MQSRRHLSLLAMYLGFLAVGLSVIAFALVTVVRASVALSSAATPQKTSLELQLESSREIRRALAARVVQPPPLPPITARVAHQLTAQAERTKKPAVLSPEARNAMAMDPGGPPAPASPHYPVIDRQTSVF